MSHRRTFAIAVLSISPIVACGGTSLRLTSQIDAGQMDSGVPDAGPIDAGTPDAGPVDAGVMDAGFVDTGPPDAGCMPLSVAIFGNPGAEPSTAFRSWLTASSATVESIQTDPGAPISAADLQSFDVIILDWLTRDYTASEASILSAWVSSGGGLMSLSGFDNNPTDDWHANSLLAPLAVAYGGSLLNGPVTSFAMHPITDGLNSLTFTGGYGISDLGGSACMRTPIAFASDGTSVAYAVQMGSGHAFIWGDEWIEFDSEWSGKPDTPKLWFQAFEWLAQSGRCPLLPPR